jgi:hypothetical protein
MSGETHEWTVATLKELMETQLAASAVLSETRLAHLMELRAADERALQLALKNNAEHFERLNENAARTIEERAHFVANEVFGPFRDQVNEALTLARGRQSGVHLSAGVLLSAIVALGAVLGIVVALANALTNS